MTTPSRHLLVLITALSCFVLTEKVCGAAEVQIGLPLHRLAYQTNELIHLAIVRSDAAALSRGEMVLAVTGEDGSTMKFTFPVKAVPADKDARSVEHLYL